jgi:hypothetical protein
MGSAAAATTGATVTLGRTDDHRQRLKLIWSFTEAENSIGPNTGCPGLCRSLIHTQGFDLVSSS